MPRHEPNLHRGLIGAYQERFEKSWLRGAFPASKVDGNSANFGVRDRKLGRETLMTKILKKFAWWSAVLGLALSTMVLTTRAVAQDQDQQDQQDDPPSRVARIGYMEGSVS